MSAECKDTADKLEAPLDWSWSRYRQLSRAIRRMSLTRALAYEVFDSHPPQGRTLDLGGGERSDYRHRLKSVTYFSVNTDPTMIPSWTVGAGEILPCPPRSFDTVICLSTLEHIFDTEFVLNEMLRVLRPGGEVLVMTPFLYPIHGRPGVFDDFFRPTPDWYRVALARAGFEGVKVMPLFWGPFSTGLTCAGMPGPLVNFRWQLALLADLLYAVLRQGVLRRSNAAMWGQSSRHALGFFVSAIKPPDLTRSDSE